LLIGGKVFFFAPFSSRVRVHLSRQFSALDCFMSCFSFFSWCPQNVSPKPVFEHCEVQPPKGRPSPLHAASFPPPPIASLGMDEVLNNQCSRNSTPQCPKPYCPFFFPPVDTLLPVLRNSTGAPLFSPFVPLLQDHGLPALLPKVFLLKGLVPFFFFSRRLTGCSWSNFIFLFQLRFFCKNPVPPPPFPPTQPIGHALPASFLYSVFFFFP